MQQNFGKLLHINVCLIPSLSAPCVYNLHVFCIFRPAMAADLDVVNLFLIAGGTLALPILAFLASFLLWPSVLIKVYYW